MQMPDIVTEAKDQQNNFTFRVRAYRKLTPHEMKISYADWYLQRDKRRSYKNKIIEVVSIIGIND
jgi:hypothetical protein